MAKLKVCGMREEQNILGIAELGIDYMGFIFYPKSKRFVGGNFVLPTAFPKNIQKVGVFVNETQEKILSNIEKYQLDFVQLHGDESVAFCNELNKKGVKVIKAFGIDEGFDFNLLEEYKPFVEHFLFDTKSTQYGGTGHTFPWEILHRYDQSKSFFLSGGLGLEEIEILQKENYFGWNVHAIDVNSKFELSPGLKNVELVAKIKV